MIKIQNENERYQNLLLVFTGNGSFVRRTRVKRFRADFTVDLAVSSKL